MLEANTSAESMKKVWLLSVVWLASNYVQCIYFKFRRRTQEISRNKMRRNWQCTEWKKLMTWITQPVNRSWQEGRERKRGGCSYSHWAVPKVPSRAWNAVTLLAAVTSFIFMARPSFAGHKCVTVSGVWKRSPQTDCNCTLPFRERIQCFCLNLIALSLLGKRKEDRRKRPGVEGQGLGPWVSLAIGTMAGISIYWAPTLCRYLICARTFPHLVPFIP